jgi:hypothetical protein
MSPTACDLFTLRMNPGEAQTPFKHIPHQLWAAEVENPSLIVDSRFNFGQLHGRLGSVRQLRQKLMPGPFCWGTKGQTVTIGDWLIN